LKKRHCKQPLALNMKSTKREPGSCSQVFEKKEDSTFTFIKLISVTS
jgi:hypothetical protein